MKTDLQILKKKASLIKSLASPGKNASILSALRRTRRCSRKCLHSRLRHLCPTQKCAEHIWWCLVKKQMNIVQYSLFVCWRAPWNSKTL